MEQNLETKQIFLRKEILDKGYNPQVFLEHMKQLKEGGQDISVWTMDELRQIVYEYRQYYDESMKEQNKIKDQEQGIGKNVIVKQCKKYERFIDQDLNNINVIIQKPEIVTSGGFLGFGATSVLWYSLKTSIVQNQVKRADTDFDWLRTTLVRQHPNRIIPPLDKSKPISPQDTKALYKRGQMIKQFIQGLSKCQPLINSKLSITFLTWGDYPKFQDFKIQQTSNIPLNLNQFITQSGKINLQISQQNSHLIKNIMQYNISTRSAYKQIKQTIKQVVQNFQNLTASIYKIGNTFATLQQKHQDLTTNVAELKNQTFNQVIVTLNNQIIQWGKTFNTRRKAIQKHLSLMFKFTMQETQIFQKVFKKRLIVEQQYTRLRMHLHKKRESLSEDFPILNKVQIPFSINQTIKIGDLSKQDLHQHIPLSQFKSQNNLRQILGSCNASCRLQFIRLQPVIQQRILFAFRSMCKSFLQSNKSQLEVLMRMITNQY